MCATCGCSEGNQVTVTDPVTGYMRLLSHDEAHTAGLEHEHTPADRSSWFDIVKDGFFGRPPKIGAHDHSHSHHHHSHGHQHDALDQGVGTTIQLEQAVLAKNQLIADKNRRWLNERGILALNLVSSPGSGKTSILERTIRELGGKYEINVIEGDQETVNDAERIRATGCKAIQINTGTGCHLEADMLANALTSLDPVRSSLLFVENVGNLVCPALFDLGERAKVAILSVTEGEDKPLKYPHMFRSSEAMLLNKIDLLPYLNFDLDKCIAAARTVNPDIEIIQLSASTGEGMAQWYEWIGMLWGSSSLATAA